MTVVKYQFYTVNAARERTNMSSPVRYRGYTDRIPRVLVIVYFCRGLSEREPKEAHMSRLHRDKDRTGKIV